MANKIKAGRVMINIDDRHNTVQYYEYDYWHSIEKYQSAPNSHFEEHRLISDSSESIAAYVGAVEYILQNPKKTGMLDFFNPMSHYDNREYDNQCKIRDSLILSDEIELDRDGFYDERDLGW